MAKKMPLHPGFTHVEDLIAKRQHMPKKEAGAILGAAAHKASAAAKAKNPNLKKVK